MHRWRCSLTLALLLAQAPSGAWANSRGGGKQAPPKEAELVKQGKVVVVSGTKGGEPEITDGRGKRWLLTGVLRKELLRLHGHVVKVRGAQGPKKLTMPTLKVSQYEILNSGGRKPVVGVLQQQSKGVFRLLRQKDTLAIKGPKALLNDLKQRVGCKIWLVGTLKDKTIKPYSFGWLNCDPPAVIKPGLKKETNK